MVLRNVLVTNFGKAREKKNPFPSQEYRKTLLNEITRNYALAYEVTKQFYVQLDEFCVCRVKRQTI